MARAEHLILDTMKPLGQFLKYTKIFNPRDAAIVGGYLEDYLDDILGRVVDCVSNKNAAITHLWDYARQVKEDSCDPEEGVKLAKGILELGETLNQQLIELGAYSKEGNSLGYYYSGRIGHADLILTKIGPRDLY
jgi:hypothetical protein